MSECQKITKILENITFENRAWEKAEFPRLHMKKPLKFSFTKIVNFEPVTKNIHLTIGFHHGESRRFGTDRWYLTIETYKGRDCYGKTRTFSSIEDIKQHIKEKFNKNPILPERWN